MIRPNLILCAAVLLAFAQPVLAGDCKVPARLDNFANSAISPAGAKCATYLAETAETGVSCHWEITYRSGAAANFADALWKSLTTCRDGTILGPDTPVNHPDSYELREWQSDRYVYALSVKDKAALARTFVFLRLKPRDGAR